MMLAVENLGSAYGRIPVLHGVSVNVQQGRIVALVGSNGAGKTTLMRCISGIQPLSQGRVLWEGKDITQLSAAARVKLGLAQVPEGRMVFGPMTVQDNLELGGITRKPDAMRATLKEVFELFPVLSDRRGAMAGSLSGGEQQMLAIGRALMSAPRLLLLDEPSLGLAPMVVAFIFERIRELNRRGMSILVVEQNVSLALRMADEAYVLETGKVVAQGAGRALLQDPAVQHAYLGI
jgi:branched-chain amino acid transport system ATP-binding protein